MTARRGMTLVELLASLGLLASLVVVCVSWTTAMVRQQEDAGSRARWMMSAQAVLDSVARDLMSVDGLDPAAGGRVPRVVAGEAMLDVRTREAGWLGVVRYEAADGVLRRMRGGQRTNHGVPMLGEVQVFGVSIEPADEEQVLPVLSVELESAQGWRAGRVFALSVEDVR